MFIMHGRNALVVLGVDVNRITVTLSKTIAAIDASIIVLRREQINIAKIIAEEMGLPEDKFLAVVKESSIAILKNNGLEY